MKNTKKDKVRKVSSILVNIHVNRYEDTGKGFNTLEQAEASVVAYADELIAGKAGLAGVAKSFDLVDVLTEDNGKECDGEDIGRWTVGLYYVARFELVEPMPYEKAWAEVIELIEEFIGDACEDSIEEYACDFDASPGHKTCRVFPFVK
jgi:hypothetical protein